MPNPMRMMMTSRAILKPGRLSRDRVRRILFDNGWLTMAQIMEIAQSTDEFAVSVVGGMVSAGFVQKQKVDKVRLYNLSDATRKLMERRLELASPPKALQPCAVSEHEKLQDELKKLNDQLAVSQAVEEAKAPEAPAEPAAAPEAPPAVQAPASIGAMLLDELIGRISSATKQTLAEEVRKEHMLTKQAIMDDVRRENTAFAKLISNSVNTMLSELERRLYNAFGGPPEPALPVEEPVIEHTPSDIVVMKSARSRLPRACIFRVDTDQSNVLKTAYKGKLELHIALSTATDQFRQAQRLASTSREVPVFVMTKWIGHAEESVFKHKDVHRVRGGITSLKRELDKYLAAHSPSPE